MFSCHDWQFEEGDDEEEEDEEDEEYDAQKDVSSLQMGWSLEEGFNNCPVYI